MVNRGAGAGGPDTMMAGRFTSGVARLKEGYQAMIQWVVEETANKGQVVFVAHGASIGATRFLP